MTPTIPPNQPIPAPAPQWGMGLALPDWQQMTYDLCRQLAADPDGTWDSAGRGDVADAMLALARAGRLEVVKARGRRVIARPPGAPIQVPRVDDGGMSPRPPTTAEAAP